MGRCTFTPSTPITSTSVSSQ